MRNRSGLAWILGVSLLVSAATNCSSKTSMKSPADASGAGGDTRPNERDVPGAGGATSTGGASVDSQATGSGGRGVDGAALDTARDAPMTSDGGPSGGGGLSRVVDADSGGGTSGTGGVMATGGATAIDGASTTRPYATGGIIANGGTLGTGGITGAGGMDVDGGGTSVAAGPCDIYAAANTPCAAAYSMTRLLTNTYKGPLYQVRNGSSSSNLGTGGTTKDIGATPDGYADSTAADDFCLSTLCTVSVLYDQTGNGNHLKVAPKGPAITEKGLPFNYESSATKGTVTAGGHQVRSLYMAAHEGYRLTTQGVGMPVGDASQGIYEVADGTRSATDTGSVCCWEFGNASIVPAELTFSTTLYFGTPYTPKGSGTGPWFMIDLNNLLWAGPSRFPPDPGWGGTPFHMPPPNPTNPSMKTPFAAGFLKTSRTRYTIRVADVRAGTDLVTAYDGAIPETPKNEGGIVLGTGSDNFNAAWGTFYEGAITSGYPTNETDLAVLKNIQAVGYSK